MTAKLTTRFDDIEFRASHGKAPKGSGAWAFALQRNPGPQDIMFVWGDNTFTQAKKQITARLQQRGVVGFIVVFVQP